MIPERPLPNKYFVDFDNTIVDSKYNPNTGRYDILGLMPDMKESVNECAKSHEIVIFTSRPVKEWNQVTRFLAEQGVVFDGIMEKPLGIAYVDDRAMLPHEFVDKFKPRERKPIDLDEYYASEQDAYPLREDEDGNPF